VSFTVSFYNGGPGSDGSATVQLCGKKRVVHWFRDVNEEGTITSEIAGRVRLVLEGKAVIIT